MRNQLPNVTQPTSAIELESFVPVVTDFPKPGILFRDITPLLTNPDAFREITARLAHEIRLSGATSVMGLESRGFIFGIAAAQVLGMPFIPARKAGKLPGETVSTHYSLEYGEQRLEVQKHAVTRGERVAIIDDLLATGGTASAAAELVSKLGGIVSGFFFAIELDSLEGRKNLQQAPVHSILHF